MFDIDAIGRLVTFAVGAVVLGAVVAVVNWWAHAEDES